MIKRANILKGKSQRKIKVFLVDDHPAVREGVRSYLTKQGSITVVGEAGSDAEALRKVKKAAPDVVLLDITLPASDGGELARRLRPAAPRAKIIAFSIHSSQEYVVRMARCGVHGYVTKDKPTAKVVEAIHHVYKGGLYFPPDMSDAILAPGPKPSSDETSAAALTAREREVLILLAEGLANKEVARRLGISVRTAETHREHLSHKLNIMTVAGLTKYAIQQGLTSLGSPDRPKT
ncbi:MAG: response regulator transcription factor [Elusimicrobia bacterium]|nr:response regulator transcription factor [Elusimicrobiota bacterium]